MPGEIRTPSRLVLGQVGQDFSNIVDFAVMSFLRKIDGMLANEFKYIFHDLFSNKRQEICRKIVECLVQSSKEYGEIMAALNYSNGGPYFQFLQKQ